MRVTQEGQAVLVVQESNFQTPLFALVTFVVGGYILREYAFGLFAIGIALLLYWRRVSLRLDRAAGEAILTRTWLYRAAKEQYALADVAEVYLEWQGTESFLNNSLTRLSLVLADGRRVSVWSFRGSTDQVPTLIVGPVRRAGARMAAFLNVPFRDDTSLPTTLKGYLGSLRGIIRKVDK